MNSSAPYSIILKAECPKISGNCLFSPFNDIDSTIRVIQDQCQARCAAQYNDAIICNNNEMSQLLARIYNAKCAQINSNLCWVEYLINLKTQYTFMNQTTSGGYNFECTDCAKRFIRNENALANYLQIDFFSNRRQLLFMSSHLKALNGSCGESFIPGGIDYPQVSLEGYGKIQTTSSVLFPIYAYFIILIGIVSLAGFGLFSYRKIKPKTKLEYANDSIMNEDIHDDDTSHSEYNSSAKLEELQIKPNIHRLSGFSLAPVSPIHQGDFDFYEPPMSRFSRMSTLSRDGSF